MEKRLNSSRAGGRQKESPIALHEPAAAAKGRTVRSRDDEAPGTALTTRSGDISGRNGIPAQPIGPDPEDHAEYVSEWDPRLS